MTVKLSYLGCFAVVAETRSISEAAKRMGLSQPSLSRQLRVLERELGLTLCTRDHRGVILTEDGQRFYAAVAPLLGQFQALLDATAGAIEEVAGDIVCGTLEGVGQSTIVPSVVEFRREHPAVTFHVEFLLEAEIVERLRVGRLDFGVLTFAPSSEGVESERLLGERSVLVTRAGNAQGLETAAQLAAARFVGYDRQDALLGKFLSDRFGPAARAAARIALSFNSHRSMVEALEASDAFAVMPWRSVAGAVEGRRLRVASSHELEGALYLARPAGKPLHKRHRLFLEHVRRSAKD